MIAALEEEECDLGCCVGQKCPQCGRIAWTVVAPSSDLESHTEDEPCACAIIAAAEAQEST